MKFVQRICSHRLYIPATRHYIFIMRAKKQEMKLDKCLSPPVNEEFIRNCVSFVVNAGLFGTKDRVHDIDAINPPNKNVKVMARLIAQKAEISSISIGGSGLIRPGNVKRIPPLGKLCSAMHASHIETRLHLDFSIVSCFSCVEHEEMGRNGAELVAGMLMQNNVLATLNLCIYNAIIHSKGITVSAKKVPWPSRVRYLIAVPSQP